MTAIHQQRPLYGEKGEQKFEMPQTWDQSAHAGLWYDKFCNTWVKEDDSWYLGEKKTDWIRTVTKEKVGDQEQIREAVDRLQSLVEARSGWLLPMRSDSRWVTGLGRSHPVENGFAWHPTLGTAYLPGSSLKGMVRAWARELGETDQAIRLLGPEAGNSSKRVGEWIFFDALPTKPVQLEMDIMTPHYSKYYADPLNQSPHDREDPIPIPFLTVAKDQPFLFAIAPRRPKDGCEKQQKDRERLSDWIQQALEWIGAGAKTAVGYGRFQENQNEQEEWRKKQAQAEKERRWKQLPPLQREMAADGYGEEDPNRFEQAMAEKWLLRLKEETVTEEEKAEIAKLLAAWYKKQKPKDWEKPGNKKNKEKVALIKGKLPKEEA